MLGSWGFVRWNTAWSSAGSQSYRDKPVLFAYFLSLNLFCLCLLFFGVTIFSLSRALDFQGHRCGSSCCCNAGYRWDLESRRCEDLSCGAVGFLGVWVKEVLFLELPVVSLAKEPKASTGQSTFLEVERPQIWPRFPQSHQTDQCSSVRSAFSFEFFQ